MKIRFISAVKLVITITSLTVLSPQSSRGEDCWCQKQDGWCLVGNGKVAGASVVGEAECTLERCIEAWNKGVRDDKEKAYEICPKGYPPPPTEEELKCAEAEITAWIKNHPEISWVRDGCFVRATDLYASIIKICPGLENKINQQWLTGRLCPSDGIVWGYHTALCFMKDGEKMIIDPAMGQCCNDGNPIFTYDDWVTKCKNQSDTSKCEVTKCTGESNALCVRNFTKEPWYKDWLRRAKCWFPCFGKLMEELKKCKSDDLKCKGDAISSCTTCGAEDKNNQSCQGINPPFKSGTSGDLQTCEWASSFYRPPAEQRTSRLYENTEHYLFTPMLFVETEDDYCLLTDETALTGEDYF